MNNNIGNHTDPSNDGDDRMDPPLPPGGEMSRPSGFDSSAITYLQRNVILFWSFYKYNNLSLSNSS
ncbi:hypothetical protein I4U23_021897 [Adineta vaga]|nr:hypothetical protein I4U23_021897 [Adineta vaga]